MNSDDSLPALPLDPGIESCFVDTLTGLRMHYLAAGEPGAPLLLLLHGFPELAFSWRRIIRPLAQAGYRVVAPDLRGYGRTTGWDGDYDGDLRSFAMANLVRDLLGLLRALDRDRLYCVIGHDFGSPLAAWASLLRPDVFRRALLMSAPFAGPPALEAADPNPDPGLRRLAPPRKHYQWYYCTPGANRDMLDAPQGLKSFLRAYFHMKSADWPGNVPGPLADWSAGELARLPAYYVMNAGDDMPAAVGPAMPGPASSSGCEWLSDADLEVYATEYGRTGFQGGLNWYRCAVTPSFIRDLAVYAGRRIETPLGFIAGASDWGYRQTPGALETMETRACADFRGTCLVRGAGHWVQQEQPRELLGLVVDFLERTAGE